MFLWKFRIKALLSELDVLKVINDEVPAEVDDAWKKAEHCAKSTIIEYLGDSFLSFATGDVTARQILKNLDAVYERKSLASQLALRKRLLCLKLPSEMPLLQHCIIVDDMLSELLAAGAKLDEMDKVSHLLITLPSSYDGIVTAIETLSDENSTLAFVKTRLLDQEVKIKNENNDTSKKVMSVIAQKKNNVFKNRSFKKRLNNQQNTFKRKQNNRIKCHHCGKEGHIKKDCYSYKRSLNNNNNKENNNQAQSATSAGFAFMVRDVKDTSCGFVLDSGASDHLINDESLYADCMELTPPVKIAVAKQGQFIFATKRGIVRLQNDHTITLEDVLYCKEAA